MFLNNNDYYNNNKIVATCTIHLNFIKRDNYADTWTIKSRRTNKKLNIVSKLDCQIINNSLEKRKCMVV